MTQGALSESTARALARGIELFNRRAYWESHEAWEEAWLEEEDETKLFLQGLIQVAAGYHKATVQMQPKGCVKLLGTGLDKLRPLPDGFGGVSLARFIAAVERTLEEARRWRAGDVAEMDRALLPRIELI